MHILRTLLIGIVVISPMMTKQAHAQKQKKPSSIAPAEPLKDGWEEIDKRLIFLMVRLANVEASLDAVEKRVGSGTRRQATRVGEAKEAEGKNERMDRKGGGPVKWSEFYGRTAEAFFYHPVDRNTTYHTTTVLRQQSPQADNQSGDGIPSRQGLPVHQRPPQFDYIYKANRDAQARAEREASQLHNKVDALVARRRQLEDEQSALWCQIAFRAVSRYELPKKQLYRFEPIPVGPDTESRQHAEVVKVAAIFMRRALSIVEVAEQDQAKAFGSIKVVVNSACDKLDEAWLQQGILTDDAPDLKTPAGKFAALSKKLKDVSENLSDSYVVSIDGDRFKDEQRKNTFRGLLQESLVDYAQIVLALNEMSLLMAHEWKVKPDVNMPLKFVSLEIPAPTLPDTLRQSPAIHDSGDDSPPRATAEDASKSRTAYNVALMVLQFGGTVTLRVNGQEDTFTDPERLPSEEFVVESIKFHDNKRITDGDMLSLRNLKTLKKLWLSGTNVTDAGLSHLAGLSELEYLYLGGANVTDRGLLAVGEMKQLRFLGLFYTKVTDKGMQHLRHLTKLEEINLGGTSVSNEAVRRVLPNCKIKHQD